MNRLFTTNYNKKLILYAYEIDHKKFQHLKIHINTNFLLSPLF